MFHDDLQIHPTNNWKRNTNEHPIDRILTGYSNPTHQIKNSQSKNYKSETKHIIQRQRVIRSFLNKPDELEPSIRKPSVLSAKTNALSITSIPSPQLLYADLNEHSTNNNNRQQTIKKELDRQSPVLNHRYRSTLENLSSIQQTSDITNNSGNYIPLTVPQNFIFRNTPSRVLPSDRSSFKINSRMSSPRLKPLMYSKTISEGTSRQYTFNPKSIQQINSFPPHTKTPTLSEQGTIHTRTLNDIIHSKTHLSKTITNRRHHQLQSEKMNTNPKINYIQDLYISPRSLSNPHHDLEMNKKIHKKGFISDEWRDSKSSNGSGPDDDESISADGNSSTSTCNSQVSVQQSTRTSSSPILSNSYDLFLSPNLLIDNNSKSKPQRSPTKRNIISRRRGYNLALPPVAEHVDDEETDMNKILEKINALQKNKKKFNLSLDDEDSLTFQLLNQQETEFEKKLSNLRKLI